MEWNIDQTLENLALLKKRNFQETIDLQIAFFANLSMIGKVKKNRWTFSFLFPKPAGRKLKVKLISNDVAAANLGALEVTEFISFMKKNKKIDSDILLVSSDCLSSIPSPILKKLGQQNMTPKEELCTSSPDIVSLEKWKREYEEGFRKMINFRIDKFASFLYAPLSVEKEDAKTNFLHLLKFIENDLKEILDAKKNLTIKSMHCKTTMGQVLKINK